MTSNAKDRQRDRKSNAFPTPDQVRISQRASDEKMAQDVYRREIEPQLRNADNYFIGDDNVAYIEMHVGVSMSARMLHLLRTVVQDEFIAKTPGWSIATIESHDPPDEGDLGHVFIRIDEE